MPMNKLRFKTAIFFILLMMPMFIFAGCGGLGDQSLQHVNDYGVLVLGLDENYPPMGYKDGNGDIVGFDIDVADEVCHRLGLKLITKPVIWELKERELADKNIDCIWNGLSYTKERAETMTLSDPYMANDVVFVVRSDSGIKSISDLKGKKIGAQTGASARDALMDSEIKTDITVTLADDTETLLVKLEDGKLDAVCLDSVYAYYYIQTKHKDFEVLPDVLASEDFVIGFRKGDEALRDEVQKVLSEMRADGTLAKISEEWFGKDVTTVQ